MTELSAMTTAPIPFGTARPRNRLLAGLSPDELATLRPHLALVGLSGGQTLFRPGDAIEHVYFVEQGLLSLMADTGADDMGIEVGMIGPEGIAGLSCLTGSRPVAFHHIEVQLPGSALRMGVGPFRHLLDEVPALRGLCFSYLDAFVIQIAQIGACHGRHRVPERCASWLLAACDRAGHDEFPLTHEALSARLGVRRAGVTNALSTMQEAGLVRSGKGMTAVLDHAGLERAACGCYRLVRDRYQELLACA